MDEGKRSALLSEASLLSAAVALGTNPVAVKYAVEQVPPLPFVALRFTCAGLVVLAFLLFLGSNVRLKRKHLLPMAGLGLIGVGLNNVMFTFGGPCTKITSDYKQRRFVQNRITTLVFRHGRFGSYDGSSTISG